MNYVIGCGGVGSWLIPSLVNLVKPDNLTLVDGDTLETKNLDRQFFNSADVGKNKAAALATHYGCKSIPEWYNVGLIAHEDTDILFVAVDNHPARVSALCACDNYGASAIVGANETFSADSYLYLSQWKGSRLDPRVQDPTLETDKAGDPQRAAMGCFAKRDERPQLITANKTAAVLMERLYVLWFMEWPKMPDNHKLLKSLSYKLRANLNNLEIEKVGEL